MHLQQQKRLFFSLSLHLNVVLVEMEKFSTKHKCEWRTQNNIVDCQFLQTPQMTKLQLVPSPWPGSRAVPWNNQSQNLTPSNPCSHSIFPLMNSPHLIQAELFLGKLKMQMQPRSSSRSPRAIPALPGSTDTWQQHRSLICLRKWALPPITRGVSCSRWQWQFSSLLWQVLQHLIAFRQTNWRSFLTALSRVSYGTQLTTPCLFANWFCFKQLEESKTFSEAVRAVGIRI